MAINRKLIHFKTWNTFISQDGVNGNYSVPSSGSETDGTAVYGQLLGTSIVFIKDVQKIWTHGQLYDCGASDLSNYLTKDDYTAIMNSIDGLQSSKLDIDDANETFATIELISALDESKLNVSDAEQTYATITNLERKQDKLISGLSIKTINEESIVGSGNITIDTSVLNSTGVSEIRPMSQKATTDAIDTEVTRATTKESELETRIAEHESITEETYTLANDANIYAQTAFTNSQEAVNTANAAKEAVKVLEGLGGTDEAQTTLADRVQQISTNTSDINVLKAKHVLITEEEFDALELKDPEKIYLIYEE